MTKTKPFTARLLNELGFYETEPNKFTKASVIEQKQLKKGKTKKETKLDSFLKLAELELGIQLVPEYRFSKERRYRLDYALPDLKIGIECDGAIWARGNSGHSSGTGIKRDQQKASLLAVLGWRLIRVTPNELTNGHAIELIKQILK